MVSNLLLHLSDWNAQFFREVKGRLKSRTLALTVASSLGGQAMILLYFVSTLPGWHTRSSPYCTGSREYIWPSCVLDAYGKPQINWLTWWLHIFQALSWLLPFVLLMAGVYMLIADLAKEERRGTLNFIRLSPQTSQSILIGKLIGVPFLPVVGCVMALPFHGWAATQANIPLLEVSSLYLITIGVCAFFYSSAVLYALLGGMHSWFGAVTIALTYIVFFQFWRINHDYNASYLTFWKWYYIGVGDNLALLTTFTVGTLIIATFWIWKVINRCFRNPNRTLISKRHSYWMTLSFELFVFGFGFRIFPTHIYHYGFVSLIGLLVVNLLWFLIIIAALTPHRQTLLDWARYRHASEATPGRREGRLWKDLLFGEKSPVLVAIALNLLISIAFFTPWIFMWNDGSSQIAGFLSVLFHTLFLLICAAIVQLALFSASRRRVLLAASLVIAFFSLPPIAMLFFGIMPTEGEASIWIFSPFAFAGVGSASAGTLAFGFLAYLSTLACLTARLTQQLHRAGESQLKALMAQKIS